MRKKRTPWPRWAKILRNVLLTALLGLMMWDVWDHPTFFYMEDLRRREQQMLLPEPETVVELDTTLEKKYRIEVADDVAVTSYPVRGDFFTNANMSVHHLEDGPNLIYAALPAVVRDVYGQPMTCAAYAAVRPPEDAAAAVLTLTNTDGTYTAEGTREGDAFLFYICPEPDENGRIVVSSNLFLMGHSSYEVVFLDAGGDGICRISG